MIQIRPMFKIIEEGDGTDNTLEYPQVMLRSSYKLKGVKPLWQGKRQVGMIGPNSVRLDITRLRVGRPKLEPRANYGPPEVQMRRARQEEDYKTQIRIIAMLGEHDPYLTKRCMFIDLSDDEARKLADDILKRLAKND